MTVLDYVARRGDWIVVKQTMLGYRAGAPEVGVAIHTSTRWRLARAVRVRRDGMVTHHCRPSSYAWAKPTGRYAVEASERVRTIPALAREAGRMELMGNAEWGSEDECKTALRAVLKAAQGAARMAAEMADGEDLRRRIETCRRNGRRWACSLKARHVRALVMGGASVAGPRPPARRVRAGEGRRGAGPRDAPLPGRGRRHHPPVRSGAVIGTAAGVVVGLAVAAGLLVVVGMAAALLGWWLL